MEMIIKKNIIVNPSSPTPHTLKTHKLSSLDQIMPSLYIPLIFFYETINDESQQDEEIWLRLKQSLSDILSIFYPIAGSIKHNSFVDCDDTGVEMVEARLHAPLTRFIQNPKREELETLLPTGMSSSHDDNLLLLVKTTFFDCGGLSIGVYMSHKVADAASFATFMHAWAATCRREEPSRIIQPTFDLALHFPPATNIFQGSFHVPKEKCVSMKSFVNFDAGKLEKLRKLHPETSSYDVKQPTKVEAVSAFLWRNFIDATKARSPPPAGEKSIYIATHIVNLRPRTVPPLPDHTFGNCIAPAIACISSEEEEEEEEEDDDCAKIGVLVSKMRTAIRAVDNEYISNVVKDDQKYLQALDQTRDFLHGSKLCQFSSWRFPVYDVDFGWGKPVWVCTTGIPNPNLTVMMDTPYRDGIEALVNFPDDDSFQMFQLNYNKLLHQYLL